MILSVDVPASTNPDDLEPGTLLVVTHVDGQNRVAHLRPSAELGGPDHLAGYHVVDAAQQYGYVLDERVSVRGNIATHKGTDHLILGRHDHRLPPAQRRRPQGRSRRRTNDE